MSRLLLIDMPMPIRTPRLLLRPRSPGEGAELFEAVQETLGQLVPWMPWASNEYSVDEAEAHCRHALARFLLREDMTLSIYNAAGTRLLGSTGIHKPDWQRRCFELGYWVRASEQGKGYITEAVNALTRYVFEVLDARRVEIHCDSRNERSLKVMERLGYEREGLLRAHGLGSHGEARDTLLSARIDLMGLPDLELSWGGSMPVDPLRPWK